MPDIESPIVHGLVVPSARAQQLLVASHTIASRAWLLSEDGQTRAELPLVSGSVSIDSGSMVRRTASLVVHAAWSDSPHSRLAPYGSRVQVQRGIRIERDVIEWMTLMTGPIWESAVSDDHVGPSRMTIPLKDEMAIIAQDRFDAATATDTTETVVAAITRLIRRTLPDAEVIDLTGSTTRCGALDMQQDPAGGIDKLATSIGAECFAGRGWRQFVIRPVPTLADPPRWALTVGQSGNVVGVDRKRSREKVYNRVVARGETNNTGTGTAVPPVSGEAAITDSADPLRYGGPFGRNTRFYVSPLLTTTEQAAAAAASLLERTRGRNVEFSFTSLVNPALDAGDVIRSQLSDGVTRAHIVDSTGVPLGVADTQSVATRGIELPDEAAGSAA